MTLRIFPHPWLSLLLAVTWLLLTNSISLGNILLGVIFGILIPFATQPYWPDAPRMVKPWKFPAYALVVGWDIITANFIVARKVLFERNEDLRPCWVSVPLEITSPAAISILAGTITLTPGTVTADISSEGHALLVHCLDAPDPDAVRDEIKSRYESRLKEMFS